MLEDLLNESYAAEFDKAWVREQGGVQIRMKDKAVRFLSDLCPKMTASTVV